MRISTIWQLGLALAGLADFGFVPLFSMTPGNADPFRCSSSELTASIPESEFDMTTVKQVEGRHNIVRNLWVVGTCALLGAAFGFIAFFVVLSSHEALGIIQIGHTLKLSTVAPGNFIEDPNAVVERLKSKAFAKAIGERLHDQRLDVMLPATQYGGKGGVRPRLLRDGTQVEVRLNADTDGEAVTALEALFAQLIEEHKKVTALSFEVIRKREKQLQDEIDRALELDKFIDNQLRTRQVTSENIAEFSFLMTARGQSSRLGGVLYELKLADLPPIAQETRVVSDPAIGRPILSTPWLTALLGLIAGAALGLALLQIRRIISS